MYFLKHHSSCEWQHVQVSSNITDTSIDSSVQIYNNVMQISLVKILITPYRTHRENERKEESERRLYIGGEKSITC